MIPAMPASSAPSRRIAGSVLRFGRLASMGTLTLLILVAGVWASWGTAHHVMLTKGRERGTVVVTACGESTCTGPFTPVTAGSQPRARVVIEKSYAVRAGRTYDVVVKPGGDEVVRSGPAGILYAWAPLAGALLLASVVVAGGLGLGRLGKLLAGAGLALLTAAFLTG
ncbi:hypothetical protein ACIPEL_14200 [Streptomyces griseoviridis]